MKPKFGLLALLVVLLLVPSMAFGATFTLTANKDAENHIGAGEYGVIGSFYAEGASAGKVKQIALDARAATIAANDMVVADINAVSVWIDTNQDGKLDREGSNPDVLVASDATDNFGSNGAIVTMALAADDQVAVAAGQKVYFIVVIETEEVPASADKASTIDVDVTLTDLADATVQINAGGAAWTDDILDFTATHLTFKSTGYNAVTGSVGGEMLQDGVLLNAVDDWGNVDTDFVEKVQFLLYNYSTLEQITADFTATSNGAVDAKWGASWTTSLAMVAGVLEADTGGAAGEMLSVKYAPTTGIGGAVTLVARSQVKELEGSITITNDTAAPNFTGNGLEAGRGIEIYDVNHDGHIDHATIFFNAPVTVGALTTAQFSLGSNYTLMTGAQGAFGGADFKVGFDAGGKGIRNAGTYGVTVRINQKTAYDTDVKPDITYTSNASIADGAATPLSSFSSAQAVEVDKAKPFLINAATSDAGTLNGAASNGMIDNLILTFSEQVSNISAGADTTNTGLVVEASAGISFTGVVSVDTSGKVITLGVVETAPNTGLTPEVRVNQAPAVRVKDRALGATGAASYNAFFPDKTDTGTEGSFTARDEAPMVVHTVKTLDLNANGRLDAIDVIFSEDATVPNKDGVGFYSSISAFSSAGLKNGEYTPLAVVAQSTNTFRFTIDPCTEVGVYDTEALPYFRYSVSEGSITDVAGNELPAYGAGQLVSPTAIDGAAPIIVSVKTGDAFSDTAYAGASAFEAEGANGRIDKLTFVFSEKVQTTEGANISGATTALDHAVGQFTLTHPILATVLTKTATSAAFGKPTWTDADNFGETSTTLVIPFYELPFSDITSATNYGDTGSLPTYLYTKGAQAYNIVDLAVSPNELVNATAGTATDGAAPFVVQGLGKGWRDNAFANIQTYDANDLIAGNTTDDANGNGYLEGFKLYFSEALAGSPTLAAGAFTTVVEGAGDITFGANCGTAAGSTLTITGTNDKESGWDTGFTPTLSYDASKGAILDATGNEMGSFTDRPSYDAAAPVIVEVNKGEIDTELVFTFSEAVYGHYTGGERKSIDSLLVSSSTLFGYKNEGSPGASGFTAAYVAMGDAENKIVATVNAAITKQDIAADKVWVRAPSLFDDADAVETALNDNTVVNSVNGSGLLVKIFDDVVSPWIISTKTVDLDGNGYIDHLRFQFSEAIKDATLRGYIAANAMTEDVSSTWIISGYTGAAYWNLYDTGTQATVAEQAGFKAAVADGKPLFSDNNTDDAILYLELEEDKVPVYATTGYGSTGWAPTVTWGSGANAVTLEDKSQNLLDTAKPTTEDGVTVAPAPTNGKVVDDVGPAIVKAVYDAGIITLYFSEPIQDNKAYPDVQCLDFVVANTYGYSCNGAYTSKHASALGGITWPNAGTAELTVKSDWSWPADMAYGIQLSTDVTTTVVFKDDATATGGAAADLEAKKFQVDPYANGAWYTEGNLFCPTPYSAVCKEVGLVLIEGIDNLMITEVKGTQVVGNDVLVKWKYLGVENVDVYISRNQGVTYDMIEGSTTPAADGQYTWTVMAGVDHIWIQATEDASLHDVIAVSPVCSGGTDCSGTSGDSTPVDAPADLVLMDVPGDQGHWMIAMFTTVDDSRVQSYQFYRQMEFTDDADPNNVVTEDKWVYSAVIPAGVVDANGKMTCLVPDILGGEALWAIAASTSSVVSDLGTAAKEGETPVALLVDGAEKAADVVSALSEPVVGGAIDNIAPTPIETIAVDDAESGIMVSWEAPEDHGIVGYITASGLGTHPIYGVSEYQVYRRAEGSDGEYEMVGSAAPLSVSYIDALDNSTTVYEYYVIGTDGNPDNAFETGTGLGFAYSGGADYNSDGSVGLGDLVLFGNRWGTESGAAGYVSAFDLNKDGSVGLGDLVLLGDAWTTGSKLAKAVSLPTAANVGIAMDAQYDDVSSTYLVNFTVNDVEGLNGLGITLSYDNEALEIVDNGITGLGSINVTKVTEEGLLDINSYYAEGEFDGTITVAFQSSGLDKDLAFELVSGLVSINNEVNAVSDLATVTLKAVPSVYSLAQNYPNPFNPTTTIEYSIPQSGHVELAIWNIAGQKVRTLVNEQQDASYRKIVWDGKNELGETVGAGIYFYKLSSGNFNKIQKMNLIK